MKKLHYILFALILFMAFTTGVEAATKCNYTWVTDLFGYTDSNGNHVDGELLFSLETAGNSNRLTVVSGGMANSGLDNFNVEFANDNGIALNSDGSCPTISVYSQAALGGFKIYKNNQTCRDGFLTTNSRCSDNLSPTAGDTDTSTGNDSHSGGQFRLTGSSESTCYYEQPTTGINGTVYNKITIEKRSNNSVRGTCEAASTYSSSCSVRFDISQSDFFPNGTFTCAPYLNTNYSSTGSNNPRVTYTIFELGREGDTDRAEDTDENWQREDAISDENWNQPIGCSDIFSEEPGSVGSILRTILGYIRVIGPILVVLLSAIDFIKAIFGFDEKAMSNAYRKLIIRLIAAIALFLIPTLIDVLLDFINASTCTDYFK